jgi:hypothetical protein
VTFSDKSTVNKKGHDDTRLGGPPISDTFDRAIKRVGYLELMARLDRLGCRILP